MATIKAITDLEQSKKLADILPLESADMAYIWHATSDNPTFRFDDNMPPMVLKDVPIEDIDADTLPCWSLAALLTTLPNYYIVNNGLDGIAIWSMDTSSNEYDNLIDVCYKLILKLHEQNIL